MTAVHSRQSRLKAQTLQHTVCHVGSTSQVTVPCNKQRLISHGVATRLAHWDSELFRAPYCVVNCIGNLITGK